MSGVADSFDTGDNCSYLGDTQPKAETESLCSKPYEHYALERIARRMGPVAAEMEGAESNCFRSSQQIIDWAHGLAEDIRTILADAPPPGEPTVPSGGNAATKDDATPPESFQQEGVACGCCGSSDMLALLRHSVREAQVLCKDCGARGPVLEGGEGPWWPTQPCPEEKARWLGLVQEEVERLRTSLSEAIKALDCIDKEIAEEKGCTCGGVDIEVGTMHMPGCGMPRIDDIHQCAVAALAKIRGSASDA